MTPLSNIGQVFYWAEFTLLALLMLTVSVHPHMVRNSWRAITDRVGRHYEDESISVMGFVTGYLFGIGTIAITGIYAVLAVTPALCTTGRKVLLVTLLVLLTDVLRGIVIMYVNGTFRWTINLQTLSRTYLDFRGLVCLVLYALLLLMPFLSSQITLILLTIIAIIYLILMGWKLTSVFPITWTNTAYLILHFIHLEILPAVIILAGAYKILV